MILPINNLMRITKAIFYIFILSTLSIGQVTAQEGDQYAERLNSLIERGVITAQEAKVQLVQINSKKQSSFHRQVRGVASKIKETKVYEITNEPLEIPSH